MKHALLVVAAIGVGCSSSSSNGNDAADATVDTVADDVASETPAIDAADSGDSTLSSIDIPATSGAWRVAEDVTFVGRGNGELGDISITHGVGTVVFHGETTPAFFYTSTSTPTGTDDAGTFSGERDFEVVALAPDRLVVTWITCAGSDLAYVYYESTDGFATKASTPASGTCTVTTSSTTENVALPAASFAPPPIVTGFTITGADVSFDGHTPGTASAASETWSLFPFHVIDCSKCATPGWFELHALFFDPATKNAGFGILYLAQNRPDLVELAFFVRLPQADDPIGEQLDYTATWTTP